MTRVAFFNPYQGGLGGGEKYLYSLLEVAVRAGTQVTLFTPGRAPRELWEELGISVASNEVDWRHAGQLSVTARTLRWDLFVAITNHFPPLSGAKRSAAIVQFPFSRLDEASHMPLGLGRLRALERRLRLNSYDSLVCYSEFVRDAIADRLGVRDAIVLPPPVDVKGAVPAAKESRIIAVGRFFPAEDANNKKHDVLIEAFRRLHAGGRAPGWSLHLAGGCTEDAPSQAYLRRLRELAAGLPIEFHPNVSRATLAEMYGNSALFWHAAGHGEEFPERFEHFGITTVEAMAFGCVPLVPALGGQLEIVEDGRNGRLWRSIDGLVGQTAELIADVGRREALAAAALRDAARFDKDCFVARARKELIEPALASADDSKRQR